MDNLLNPTSLWNEIIDLIESDISPVSFKTWIKTAVPKGFSDGKFVISVKDSVHRNILEHKYKLLLTYAIDEILKDEIEIKIIVEEAPKPVITSTAPFNGGLPLNPKYTFDTFVVGNSNRFAHTVSLAVAEEPGNTRNNPLYIYGGVGLGKTHLLHAIGNYINETDPDKKVMYVTSETFTNDLIKSLTVVDKKNKTEEFREKYRSIDVLMVDDIQFIAGKERTEEEFFHTFNALYDANKQIIIASDRPPKEMPTLSERLKSRFEWGLFGDLYSPDFETRAAILKQKAEQNNVYIPDEFILMIAEKVTSNIRELEGILNKIIAYRGLVNGEITIDIVENALKNYENVKENTITPAHIVKKCAEYYNIDEDLIMSKGKTKNVAETRQISMYIMMKVLHMSYVKIGKIFSKDRTTCMHGINKIESMMESEQSFRLEVENLIKDITNGENY